MTAIVKDSFKVKTKRKEHPNATKYPGRPSLEFGTALRKFLCDLTPEQAEKFADRDLVFEEEVTAEFYDSIQEGDIVGIGLLYGINPKNEPSAHKFKILKINKGEDTMIARDVSFEHPKSKYKGEEIELTFQDISCAFGMGFAEVLERDGKPFGVSEEIEIEVKIYSNGEETNDQNNDPNIQAPALTDSTENNNKEDGVENT